MTEAEEQPANWQSDFISYSQFKDVKDNPIELLNLIESIAKDRIASIQETSAINVEQDLYNLQQVNQQLEEKNKDLEETLKDVIDSQNNKQTDAEKLQSELKLSIHQKTKISDLENQLEQLKNDYYISIVKIKTKEERIEYLEG